MRSLSRIRMTMPSPCSIGIMETRRSTSRFWTLSLIRPSCGMRFSAILPGHNFDTADDRGLEPIDFRGVGWVPGTPSIRYLMHTGLLRFDMHVACARFDRFGKMSLTSLTTEASCAPCASPWSQSTSSRISTSLVCSIKPSIVSAPTPSRDLMSFVSSLGYATTRMVGRSVAAETSSTSDKSKGLLVAT